MSKAKTTHVQVDTGTQTHLEMHDFLEIKILHGLLCSQIPENIEFGAQPVGAQPVGILPRNKITWDRGVHSRSALQPCSTSVVATIALTNCVGHGAQ